MLPLDCREDFVRSVHVRLAGEPSDYMHILKSGCRWCDCAAQSMIYDFRSA
jgi:hypothetical protein